MRKKFIERCTLLGKEVVSRAKKISLPGFDGVPLYDVAIFFWRAIVDGSITTRASAIAFNFFLALFPTIIFLFTLIPYIPIENFQRELFLLLENVLPQNAFSIIENTIDDIINRPRGGLLSFGFFMALVFSTNGIASLMSAFDATVQSFERRSWVGQRVVSIVLLFILSILVTICIALITTGQWALNYLVEHELLRVNFVYYLILIGKWLVTIGLFFFTISLFYYFAPAKKTRWRFFSAGSTLATVLCILTSIGVSFYINNFGQYNKLYGSIGTILVVLIWLYFNAIILLVGFELNASINQAHKLKE